MVKNMYRRNLDDLEKIEDSPILSLLWERYESVWLSAAVVSKRKKVESTCDRNLRNWV